MIVTSARPRQYLLAQNHNITFRNLSKHSVATTVNLIIISDYLGFGVKYHKLCCFGCNYVGVMFMCFSKHGKGEYFTFYCYGHEAISHTCVGHIAS